MRGTKRSTTWRSWWGALILIAQAGLGAEPETIALRCGAAIDVERGARIESAVILVRDGRIAAIGPDLAIPDGARIVDLGDATVLPGLVDAHTHLLLRFEPRLGDETTNLLVALDTVDADGRALLGAAMAREMLEAGFTTVRDLGNSGRRGAVAVRDAIRAGRVPGPRMLVATRALAPPGGQLAGLSARARDRVGEEYVEITGVDAARAAVREAVFEGADLIKVIVDANTTLSPEELEAIVAEAHRAGRKVAAHAAADDAVRIAVEAGVDSVEHAYTAPDDVLRAMAARRIFLVPTDFPRDAGMTSAEQAEAAARRLARAVELGVPIAAGSDVYYGRPDRTRGELAKLPLRAYAEAGLSPARVLRAATLDAARLLGVEERTGSLAVGKAADLVAVDGDPLADLGALERVRLVMAAGRIVVGPDPAVAGR